MAVSERFAGWEPFQVVSRGGRVRRRLAPTSGGSAAHTNHVTWTGSQQSDITAGMQIAMNNGNCCCSVGNWRCCTSPGLRLGNNVTDVSYRMMDKEAKTSNSLCGSGR